MICFLSGGSSKLNIHKVEEWWCVVYLLDIPARRSGIVHRQTDAVIGAGIRIRIELY